MREYTKNGGWRQLKLDRTVVDLVRAHVEEHGIGPSEVIFPIELVVPPRAVKPTLTPEEIEALAFTAPVRGRAYPHGTLGGYVTAKCRCEGCRQWAREYGRSRMRDRRAVAAGGPKRRWAKSRDADEPYLDEQSWNQIWTAAVKGSGIPFKPTSRYIHVLDEDGESAAKRFEGLLPPLA